MKRKENKSFIHRQYNHQVSQPTCNAFYLFALLFNEFRNAHLLCCVEAHHIWFLAATADALIRFSPVPTRSKFLRPERSIAEGVFRTWPKPSEGAARLNGQFSTVLAAAPHLSYSFSYDFLCCFPLELGLGFLFVCLFVCNSLLFSMFIYLSKLGSMIFFHLPNNSCSRPPPGGGWENTQSSVFLCSTGDGYLFSSVIILIVIWQFHVF